MAELGQAQLKHITSQHSEEFCQHDRVSLVLQEPFSSNDLAASEAASTDSLTETPQSENEGIDIDGNSDRRR